MEFSLLRASLSSQIGFDGEAEGRACAEAEGPAAPTCTLSVEDGAPAD